MKFKSLLLILVFASCSTTEKIPTNRAYYDEVGNSISKENFMQKWRNKDNSFARWDYIEKGKRNITLSSPLFSRYSIDYLPLLRNLEKISGQQFDENSVILIAYDFTDDLCSSNSSNTLNKRKIKKQKSFLKPIRKKVLEAENVIFIHLFEEGIIVKNSPDEKDEYFFQDRNNFFRNTIFKDPSLCGSFALIKPTGQAFVRNGEYRADWLLPLLQPEKWNAIFPEK